MGKSKIASKYDVTHIEYHIYVFLSRVVNTNGKAYLLDHIIMLTISLIIQDDRKKIADKECIKKNSSKFKDVYKWHAVC